VEAKQVKSQNDRLAIEDGMALEKVVDRLQPPIIHYTWEQTWNPQCSRLKSARRNVWYDDVRQHQNRFRYIKRDSSYYMQIACSHIKSDRVKSWQIASLYLSTKRNVHTGLYTGICTCVSSVERIYTLDVC